MQPNWKFLSRCFLPDLGLCAVGTNKEVQRAALKCEKCERILEQIDLNGRGGESLAASRPVHLRCGSTRDHLYGHFDAVLRYIGHGTGDAGEDAAVSVVHDAVHGELHSDHP